MCLYYNDENKYVCARARMYILSRLQDNYFEHYQKQRNMCLCMSSGISQTLTIERSSLVKKRRVFSHERSSIMATPVITLIEEQNNHLFFL
jgi:hypothetical protein